MNRLTWERLRNLAFFKLWVTDGQLKKLLPVVAIIGVAILTLAIFFRSASHRASLTTLNRREPAPRAQESFRKRAEKMRQQAILKVEPTVFVPAGTRSPQAPWKTNIVTTVFWIGEGSNKASAWDANWMNHYGGMDDPNPAKRHGFQPRAFIPKQSPFYCALPYNDVKDGKGDSKARGVIPWSKGGDESTRSICKDHWVAIRKNYKTCYAQWEDCGPFRDDDFEYVFGSNRPQPNANHGSGLNVSPAVRDYLGLATTDVTDWQFVEVSDVSAGPWRDYDGNNSFDRRVAQ